MSKRTTLKMSFIPLAIIIILIIGAGYFLLQGEIKLPKFNQGPQIRRLAGFPTVVYGADLEKQRKVITNQDDLNQFLNSLDKTGMLQVKDKINFDKESVLAVSTDTQPETGHKIKIRKVYEDKKNQKLIVSIEETQMGKYCQPETDQNVAVDLAVISKTDWKIEFDRIKKSEDCKQPESTPSE